MKSKYRLQQEANILHAELGLLFLEFIQNPSVNEKFNELMKINQEFSKNIEQEKLNDAVSQPVHLPEEIK